MKQAHAGQPTGSVYPNMETSKATFDNWTKRYGNLGLLEVRKLRQLRDMDARLKRLVAHLTPGRHLLLEVVKSDI